MKKYFIEYDGKTKEVVATSYTIAHDLIFFYVGENAIFSVNKNLIESISISTEDIGYNDIDLYKFIIDNFASEFIFWDDFTIGNADYYSAELKIILGIDNELKQFGNFNKKCFPTKKDVKNKLTKDFIINAIKSHLKNKK